MQSIRRRYRPIDGRRKHFDPTPLDVGEMRLDRMTLAFEYRVRSPAQDEFDHYRTHLVSGDTSQAVTLFGSPGRGRRGTFAPKLPGGAAPLTLNGSWELHRLNGGQATLKIDLKANPTRSIRAALVQTAGQAMDSLSPMEFFQPAPDSAPGQTLDGNDNFLTLERGSWHAPLVRAADAWRENLALFAEKLVELMDSAVAPASFGFERYSDCDWRAPNGVSVVAEATRPHIRSAEAFAERSAGNAIGLMARLAPRALAAMRDASATSYPHDEQDLEAPATPAIGQALGAYSISIPETKDAYLSVYAKTTDVVRYEVRYRRGVRRAMSPGTWTADMPFADRLHAIQENALRRLQPRIELLQSVFDDPGYEPPTDAPARLADLADAVRAACAKAGAEDYFRPTFELLLLQGGLTASPQISDPPLGVVIALAESGVVEHIPSQLRAEPKSGRRYVLASQYRFLIPGYP